METKRRRPQKACCYFWKNANIGQSTCRTKTLPGQERGQHWWRLFVPRHMGGRSNHGVRRRRCLHSKVHDETKNCSCHSKKQSIGSNVLVGFRFKRSGPGWFVKTKMQRQSQRIGRKIRKTGQQKVRSNDWWSRSSKRSCQKRDGWSRSKSSDGICCV